MPPAPHSTTTHAPRIPATHAATPPECRLGECTEKTGWVHLVPAGTFTGRDGRGPYRLDTAAILQTFATWGMDLPVDYEHQSVTAGTNGQPAPAAGWIKQLDAREGGLWGRVEWTERALAMIRAKEYRYLSPVFRYQPDGCIMAILGAGLTNQPNLHLTALHRAAFAADTASQGVYACPEGCTVDPERLAIHRAALELQQLSPGMSYPSAVRIVLP
ncbi:MAG: phage protease [Pseudomonadota bacterium]|nr:phage protease [Pseudomonadota bacterium]